MLLIHSRAWPPYVVQGLSGVASTWWPAGRGRPGHPQRVGGRRTAVAHQIGRRLRRTLGWTLGSRVEARLLSLFTRQTLRPFHSRESRGDLVALKELIEACRVTPVIDRTYPLREAAEALRYIGEGHTRGKVAITV